MSPTPWYLDNTSATATDAQKDAAQKTLAHNNTPAVANLDTLGRTFLTIADNAAAGKYETHIQFDIQGNQLVVTDAMNNPVMQYSYDMAGNKIFQNSMDAGRRWMLHNVEGKPLFSWDEKDQQFIFLYDELNRPVQSLVATSGGTELLFDKVEYGDSLLKPDRSDEAAWQAKNMLGKPFNHYDTAGLVNNSLYDFKGNLVNVGSYWKNTMI